MNQILLHYYVHKFTHLALQSKINLSTARDWPVGHLLRDRHSVHLLVAYIANDPICFKIGRLTFTSNLVWFSFFFGGVGLLFHLFWQDLCFFMFDFHGNVCMFIFIDFILLRGCYML